MIRVPLTNLGRTGLKVSKLGFGTYDLGVPSLKISPEEGGKLLKYSHEIGVNLWDTSDDYGSHSHVAAALKMVSRKDVVISTKTSATTGKVARKSLQKSLKELGTDYTDIFLLHEVKADQLANSREILQDLEEAKSTGEVKAIGMSTHSVKVVKEAAQFEALDVIMTICCRADMSTIGNYPEHIPLVDGSIDEMIEAIEFAHGAGKGVIAMKVLGTSAPPLIEDYRHSIEFVCKLDFVDAMVIGMRNLDQVRQNVSVMVPS